MHQKGLTQSILQMTPILTQVIEQGIDENVVATDYPQETVEFSLASAQTIFDEGLFQWKPEEAEQKAIAFISIKEAVLGAKKGSFDEMKKILL